MVATAPTERVVSDQDIDAAFELALHLRHEGRDADLRILVKLIAQAEAARSGTLADEGETPEEMAAFERAEADIMAGRIIPHDIVLQGRKAVDAYIRRRAAGDVAPATAVAAESFRRDLEAMRRTAAADA